MLDQKAFLILILISEMSLQEAAVSVTALRSSRCLFVS